MSDQIPNARHLMGEAPPAAPRNWPSRAAFDLARQLLADLDLRMETGDSREIAMARAVRDHSLLEPVSCPACGTDTMREE
jgi:hypothetical protein